MSITKERIAEIRVAQLLSKRDAVIGANDVIALLDLADEAIRSRRYVDAADELRHAVDHVLDCEQGTVLCDDCKRLLRGAMKYAKGTR